MQPPENDRFTAADLTEVLRAAAPEVRHLGLRDGDGSAHSGEPRAVRSRVRDALGAPLDFPPVVDATVPGDRIALAADPNVPGLSSVLQACVEILGRRTGQPPDVVLWREATSRQIAALKQTLGDTAEVHRHAPDDRSQLSYLAADAAANPIYLHRILVDADFVLPIIASRRMDRSAGQDPTGLFPHFADSDSRRRFLESASGSAAAEDPLEVDWLLGIQVMVSVCADAEGMPGAVRAGTPARIQAETAGEGSTGGEPAAMVVASLDGDATQQTWANATRAISAARRHVTAGGTIVLWSAIADPPPDDWAATIDDVLAEHRVLAHSRIDRDTIEGLSLGFVEGRDELRRLGAGYPHIGLLRAAQFAGTTLQPESVADG